MKSIAISSRSCSCLFKISINFISYVVEILSHRLRPDSADIYWSVQSTPIINNLISYRQISETVETTYSEYRNKSIRETRLSYPSVAVDWRPILFLFRREWVPRFWPSPPLRPATLIEVSRSYIQSLYTNSGVVPQNDYHHLFPLILAIPYNFPTIILYRKASY